MQTQHPDQQEKPVAACSNSTWATDFLLYFHGQITLPFPYSTVNIEQALANPSFKEHYEDFDGSTSQQT